MNSIVPFLDLQAKNASSLNEFQAKLSEVIESGYYLLGKQLENFEASFAEYCGTKHCLGVGSGLDALTLVILAQIENGRLQKGDKVGVQANTFVATFISIFNAGLKPVPIDVDLDTFSVQPEQLEKAIVEHDLKGFVSVHLYGYMHKTDQIKKVCDKHEVIWFEDAAQAHGASFSGTKAGDWGIAGAFSFYPGKNLGAIGDGGAVTTSCEKTAQDVKKLRNYGSVVKYHHELLGTNSRLDELQAAFLSVKLPFLDKETSERRQIANQYDNHIKNHKIRLPKFALQENASNHVYHLYVLNVQNRKAFIEHLSQKGVSSLIHYPIAAYKQKCFGSQFDDFSCNNTDVLSDTIVSLPLYGSMTESQVRAVIDACNSF